MNLTLGLSPCPNDTFIFDAMLNGKIDTEGLTFTYQLEDVETLNRLAKSGSLDISKISYGALPPLLPQYRVLNAGGALGRGVGPVFISKKFDATSNPDLSTMVVALPGIHTTAHLLFSLAYPEVKNKSFIPFHEIEEAVLQDKVDAGVIIHENRFTYQEKGLNKLADLGEVWEKKTGHPIPLGGIVARRNYDLSFLQKINRVIYKSLEYAFAHDELLPDFVKINAQEMSEKIMRNHIDLYVNDFSLNLGTAGRSAVWKLLELSNQINNYTRGDDLEVFID